MALTHSTAGGRARPGGESRQRGELPRAGSDFGTRRAAFPPCPAGRGRRGRRLTLGWLGVPQLRLRRMPSELINECTTTGEPTHACRTLIVGHRVPCEFLFLFLLFVCLFIYFEMGVSLCNQTRLNALWPPTCGDAPGYKAES